MKEKNIKIAVLDASYILAYFMPDEEAEDVTGAFYQYRNKDLNFIAPHILPFEVVHAVKSACRSRRITRAHAQRVIEDFMNITVAYIEVDFQAALAIALEKTYLFMMLLIFISQYKHMLHC